MLKARIIPCLLIRDRGLYKTVKFSAPKYVGDPINAVKIFNEKEVDELLLFDITVTVDGREPDFALIEDIASECFMPLTYGGGIHTMDHIRRLHRIGVEKVSLNSVTFSDPEFVRKACETFGSSSIIATMDVKRNFFGKHEVWVNGGRINTKADAVSYAKGLAALGVGEILVNSIDRDGTMTGYDIPLLKSITEVVQIPVIGCGGAGSLQHLQQASEETHVSAVAAGSLFVFHGKHKAVLINYPLGGNILP